MQMRLALRVGTDPVTSRSPLQTGRWLPVRGIIQQKPLEDDYRPPTLHSQLPGLVALPNAFSSLPGNDIRRLCEEGELDFALNVLSGMRQQGTVPSVDMYRSLLKACNKRKSLADAKRLHGHLMSHGVEATRVLGEYLVSTLVNCGGLEDALQVFHGLQQRTAFSWTALISGYTLAGQGLEALKLYRRMQQEGLKPTKYTFVSLIKACAVIPDLEEGKRMHAEALKYNCQDDLYVGTCLVSMYVKCGSIVNAQIVFQGLSQRSVVSWNVMLTAYASMGKPEVALQLYDQMLDEDVSPTVRTFVYALQSCGAIAEEEGVLVGGPSSRANCLKRGKAIHVEAWKRGYKSSLFVSSALISMYSKCGSIMDAQDVFDVCPERNVVLWNVMLAAYAQQGQAEKALQLYEQMWVQAMSPDVRTFVSALQACGMLAEEESAADGSPTKLKAAQKGKALHAEVWKRGCDEDVFVGNTLIALYGKAGSIVDAEGVFDGMSEQGVVSWNSILAAYVQLGHAQRALDLYADMLMAGVTPDERTFVSTLQASRMLVEKEHEVPVLGQFVKLEALNQGKIIHADIRMRGYDSYVFIVSTLISMYSKCGSTADAQIVFDRFPKPTRILWNVMLTAYVQQCEADKALQLYRKMQEADVSADEVTFLCILQACSHMGDLDFCVVLHHTLVSTGYVSNSLLASTLIHAYGRCGSMINAQNVFHALLLPDVVSWTALIAGYAREGNWERSLQCYEEMQLAGVKPNGVTFLALLSACSHAGLVDRGVKYFVSMTQNHGIAPEVEHFVSMVDLLGRAGYFTWVEDLLSTIPVKGNLSMWLCLLSACRKHGKVALGKLAFDQAVSLQPTHSAAYFLMSNIYEHAGLEQCAAEVNECRLKACAWKKPGHSWVGYVQKVEAFLVGDLRHTREAQLVQLLDKLSLEGGIC